MLELGTRTNLPLIYVSRLLFLLFQHVSASLILARSWFHHGLHHPHFFGARTRGLWSGQLLEVWHFVPWLRDSWQNWTRNWVPIFNIFNQRYGPGRYLEHVRRFHIFYRHFVINIMQRYLWIRHRFILHDPFYLLLFAKGRATWSFHSLRKHPRFHFYQGDAKDVAFLRKVSGLKMMVPFHYWKYMNRIEERINVQQHRTMPQ